MPQFCTAINCMDGRTQLPVINFLQQHFGAEYVDVVSEAGPNRILADASNEAAIESILKRVRISVDRHNSVGIAVIGHHDCAGNPTPEAEQRQHTIAALQYIRSRFEDVPAIGLWVGDTWQVSEVTEEKV